MVKRVKNSMTFFLGSILANIDTVTKSTTDSEWDLDIRFSDVILPELFEVFAQKGVTVTIISPSGEVLNKNPLFLITRKTEGQVLSLNLSTKVSLGERSIKKKVKINAGDNIIFSYEGSILREFVITQNTNQGGR